MAFHNSILEISFIGITDESFYESHEKVFIPIPPPENIKKNNNNGKKVKIKEYFVFPTFIF